MKKIAASISLVLLLLVIFNNGRIYDELLNGKLFSLTVEIEPKDHPLFHESNGILIYAYVNPQDGANTPAQQFIIYPHSQILKIYINPAATVAGLSEIQFKTYQGKPLPPTFISKVSLSMRKQLLKDANLPMPYQIPSSDVASTIKLDSYFKNVISEAQISKTISEYKLIRASLIILACLILVFLFRNLFSLVRWKKDFSWQSLLDNLTTNRQAFKLEFNGLIKKCFNISLLYGCLLLALGLVCLIGRFEWQQATYAFTLRTYILSAYLFIITIAFIYFISNHFMQSKTLIYSVTALSYLYFTLPLRWLGLDHFFRARFNEPNYFDWRKTNLTAPRLDWLSTTTFQFKTIPYELWFFLGLLIFIFLSAWLLKKNLKKEFWLAKATKKFYIANTLLILLVVIQAWLHLSMRSPYSYLPHFEMQATADYWYHSYLLPDSKGAVNADYPIFRDTERLFLGANQDLAIIKGRVWPMYLSAQMAYFVNPYYIWLCMNIFAWLLAMVSICFFAKKLFLDYWQDIADIGLAKQMSYYTGFFLSISQGLILYVAQPMPYAISVSAIAVLITLYYWLFLPKNFKSQNSLIFGIALGLYMLTYEAQPWVIAFIVFSIVLNASFLWTFVSILLALGIQGGFVQLGTHLGHLNQIEALTPIGGHPLTNIIQHLMQFDFLTLGLLTFKMPLNYFARLFHAFHLALPAACIGFFLLKNRRLQTLILTLLIPSFLTYGLMDIGESFYIQFPRLVFSAYPAIYILNAFLIVEAIRKTKQTKYALAAKCLAWTWLALTLVIANIDVIGLPQIYHFWFSMNPFSYVASLKGNL